MDELEVRQTFCFRSVEKKKKRGAVFRTRRRFSNNTQTILVKTDQSQSGHQRKAVHFHFLYVITEFQNYHICYSVEENSKKLISLVLDLTRTNLKAIRTLSTIVAQKTGTRQNSSEHVYKSLT